jgi:hydrogenase maturation protein HypF
MKSLLSSVNKDLPVGLTGGISYNYFITDISKKISKELDIDLYLHKNIPNGDGGISIGQNLIIGAKISH